MSHDQKDEFHKHFIQLVSLSSSNLQPTLHLNVIMMILTSFVAYDDERASVWQLCVNFRQMLQWSHMLTLKLTGIWSEVYFVLSNLFCLIQRVSFFFFCTFFPGSLYRWRSYNEMYRYLIVCCLCSSSLQAPNSLCLSTFLCRSQFSKVIQS